MPRRSAARPAERERVGERPADFDRLPKRYKEYIAAMEHKLYALERLVEELPESNVQIQTYESGVKPRYLSDGVRLQLSSPDGRLLIYPEISNEIGVKVGRL